MTGSAGVGCSRRRSSRWPARGGWRIPFLVGGPLGLAGLYLRTRVRETPVFTELAESDETETEFTGTFRDLWVDYKRPLFAPRRARGGTQRHELHAAGAMMAVIPLSGRLSDRLGRRPMWWVSLVGLFVMAVPMYLLMAQSFVPETARASIRGTGVPGVDTEVKPFQPAHS